LKLALTFATVNCQMPGAETFDFGRFTRVSTNHIVAFVYVHIATRFHSNTEKGHCSRPTHIFAQRSACGVHLDNSAPFLNEATMVLSYIEISIGANRKPSFVKLIFAWLNKSSRERIFACIRKRVQTIAAFISGCSECVC
jgi:hypothetical protein